MCIIKTMQAASTNDLINPEISNTKINDKITMLDSIHGNNKDVPDPTSENQFDQFVSTSFDDSDDNNSNDNEMSLQLKSTDNMSKEEVKAEDKVLKSSQSMPEMGEIITIKPILKQPSYTKAKGSNRQKQSSLPSLKSISELTSMTEAIDDSGSSLSSSETLSKGCAIARSKSFSDGASNSNTPLISRTCSMPEMTSKNVSFKSVEIREYEVTLVDNPACRNGPPIGLSWNCLQEDTQDFFDYESARTNNRRTARQMIVPKNYRKEMLKNAHSEEEIKRVKKEMKKIRSSRNATIMFGSMFEVKEALENAGRSIKKKMKSKKNNDKDWSSSHI